MYIVWNPTLVAALVVAVVALLTSFVVWRIDRQPRVAGELD
jgi:hypothetical protein